MKIRKCIYLSGMFEQKLREDIYTMEYFKGNGHQQSPKTKLDETKFSQDVSNVIFQFLCYIYLAKRFHRYSVRFAIMRKSI